MHIIGEVTKIQCFGEEVTISVVVSSGRYRAIYMRMEFLREELREVLNLWIRVRFQWLVTYNNQEDMQ